MMVEKASEVMDSKSSSSQSEIGSAEDVVQALLDYLVAPMLPLKSAGREVPSLEQQQSVAKQVMLEPPPEGTFDIEDRNLPIKSTAKDSTLVETPLLTEEVVPTDSDAPKKGKMRINYICFKMLAVVRWCGDDDSEGQTGDDFLTQRSVDLMVEKASEVMDSKSSSSQSEIGSAEDVVQALLDYLVAPMLPLKSAGREVPSLEQQQSVAKQVMLEPPPEGTFDIEDRNLPIKSTAKDSTLVETPLLTEEVVPTDSDAPKKGKVLLVEIKEINEQKYKEDDALLAIAAANKQPIIPHMEFEYPDSDIHEDLYQLIKYSYNLPGTDYWGSLSAWAEDTEDVVKAKNQISQSGAASVGESNGSPVGGATVITTKDSNPSKNGDESNPPEQLSSCQAGLVTGGNGMKEDGLQDYFQAVFWFHFSHIDGWDAEMHFLLLGRGATPTRHGNATVEGVAEMGPIDEILPSLEGGCTRPVSSSNEVIGHFKIEREEGELSPNGDFEDNFAAYGDGEVEAACKSKDNSPF
ncbi:unnamed protein product [Camellia sinensis]